MPPFRSYLVLSLIFFVVAFFDPGEGLGLFFEPEPETQIDSEAHREAVREKLEEHGIVIESGEAGVESDPEPGGLRIQIDGEGEMGTDCEVDESDLEDIPDWLRRRLTPERMQHICEQTKIDNGRRVVDSLVDNVPAALIVLLPLMALVLKALYPLSRRYYVEHLLFFVHFHAFFFLILTLQILFARIAALLHLPEAVSVLTIVVASFYIPVHLFISMRRVYGQGRLATFLKYIVLSIAYLVGFLVTMLGALIIAVFSI